MHGYILYMIHMRVLPCIYRAMTSSSLMVRANWVFASWLSFLHSMIFSPAISSMYGLLFKIG